MNKLEILPVRRGWSIRFDDSEVSSIESNSFNLLDVRFKKGGDKLIQLNQLVATVQSNQVYPYFWSDNYSVWVEQGDEPSWNFRGANRDGTAETSTQLVVKCRDEGVKYCVTQKITILKDHDLLTTRADGDMVALEFTDPYFMHIVGPAYEMEGNIYWPGIYYPGMETYVRDWKKRWDMFAFETAPGRFYGWKHHHYYYCEGAEITEGGLFAVLGYEGGDIAYRVLTPGYNVGICWWGYDAHFYKKLPLKEVKSRPGEENGWGTTPVKAGEEFDFSYELSELPEAESKEIRARSEFRENSEIGLRNMDRPRIERHLNRFDKKTEFDDQYFCWRPGPKGAFWDKSVGYDDAYSLRLESDGSFIPAYTTRLGQEMFMEPVYGGKKYRTTAYIKTENVSGAGARVSVCFGVPVWKGMHGILQPFEYAYTEGITGTSDWIKVEVITTAPEDVISVHVALELNGSGKAWIDNFLFEEVK